MTQKGIYEVTTDSPLQDMKRFQDFLYRNLREYKHCKTMYPHSSQPAKLYGTAKTHIFNNKNEVEKEELTFCPITD